MNNQPDFHQLMADSGLPTTEEAAKKKWEDTLTAHDISIENNSPFSPFWRTVKALITKPVVELLAFVAQKLMPNLFLQTASRDYLINLHGPSRNVFVFKGIKAKGILSVTRTSNEGSLTIPINTLVQSDDIGGVTYKVKLLDSVTLDEGNTAAQVMVEALEIGEAYNLPANSYYLTENEIEGVTITNTNNWLVIAGADEEETEAYRLRIRNAFGTGAKWHTNSVYKQIITDFGIPLENIEIINDAPRGPGTADAYIYLNVGVLSNALLSEINKHIRDKGHHGHGDDFLTYTMPTQLTDLQCYYTLHNNESDIEEDLTNFIKAAFRLNSRYDVVRVKHNDTFSLSILKTQLHNYFPQLKSVTFNVDTIECGLWLPKLNNLTVTRNE